MPRITRKFEFDAGHRVLGHESKCAHLHGHRYVAEVTIDAAGLDHLGRVIDFSVIKKIIGDWIDEHWDHNLLLHANDPMAHLWYRRGDFAALPATSIRPIFGNKVPWITDRNPTAENIAEMLFLSASDLLPRDLAVSRVRIYETPNCWADYSSTSLSLHGGNDDHANA